MPYCHIFFNDSEEEINRNYLKENEKEVKIKIITDYDIKSFNELFSECYWVRRRKSIRFNRNSLTNISSQFYKCFSLRELNVSVLNFFF